MFVESIELNNYRNFDSLKVEFSPGVNIFFGDNAQGKTNLLESIYVSGTLRSHRGSRDKELIRFGEDEAHIRLFFRKDSLSHRLDVHLKKNKSKDLMSQVRREITENEILGLIVWYSKNKFQDDNSDEYVITNSQGEVELTIKKGGVK